MEYELNGNITRLKRSEGILQNGIALQVDNLKYDYIGNKLTKINDEQQNPSGYPYFVTPNIIEYDNNQNNGNGNMTKHLDKGISSIQYNYLNLPKQITQNAQVTQYVYRADGTKVKKLFGDIETNYLDGFQYKSTKPSEAGSIGGPILIDPTEVAEMKLRIIPTAEGYFDAVMNQYIYNYTDHLGNVRLSYSDTNRDGIIQPRQYNNPSCTGGTGPFDPPMCIDNWKPGEIVEVNSYYSFGLMHNYTATTQNAYQYKYNGKELQETGMYDYGARFYMPDIGRWGVVDAMAEALRRHTPYNYAYNNPIRFIDPDGNFSVSFSGEAAQQAFSAYKASMSTASSSPFGDFFGPSGNYLGSDNKKDGKIYISQGDKSNFLSSSRKEVPGGIQSLSAVQMSLRMTNAPANHKISPDTKGGLHEVRVNIDLKNNKTYYTIGGKAYLQGGFVKGDVTPFDVMNQHGVKNDIRTDISGHSHITRSMIENTKTEGQFNTYTMRASEPTDADIDDFSQHDINFISGNLEAKPLDIQKNGSFYDPQNKQGVIFYDRRGNNIMQIDSKNVNKIMSYYENN